MYTYGIATLEQEKKVIDLIDQEIDSLEVLRSLSDDFEKILVNLRLETARRRRKLFYQMHNFEGGCTKQFAKMIVEDYGL